jgi:chromosome segregation ATPase
VGELDDDLVGEVARARSAALGAERANEVLQARLAHAVAHTRDLGSSLGAAQTRLTEYREALEDSERELRKAEQDLELLTSSLSWRLTAPLRATKARLARRGTAGRS